MSRPSVLPVKPAFKAPAPSAGVELQPTPSIPSQPESPTQLSAIRTEIQNKILADTEHATTEQISAAHKTLERIADMDEQGGDIGDLILMGQMDEVKAQDAATPLQSAYQKAMERSHPDKSTTAKGVLIEPKPQASTSTEATLPTPEPAATVTTPTAGEPQPAPAPDVAPATPPAPAENPADKKQPSESVWTEQDETDMNAISKLLKDAFLKKKDLMGLVQLALAKTKVGPEVAYQLLQSLTVDNFAQVQQALLDKIPGLQKKFESVIAQQGSKLLEAAVQSKIITDDEFKELQADQSPDTMEKIFKRIKDGNFDPSAVEGFFQNENLFGADFRFDPKDLSNILQKAGVDVRHLDNKTKESFLRNWSILEEGKFNYIKGQVIEHGKGAVSKSLTGIFGLFLTLSMIQGIAGGDEKGHQ